MAYVLLSMRRYPNLPKKWRDTNKIFFGTLDLKFDTVTVTKDQTEINFVFIYKGKDCSDELVRNSPIRGIVYKTKTDSVLYYTMTADVFPYMRDSCPDIKNCRSRIIKPLQPEVVKFINDHKNDLNDWFYSAAKAKKLIQ